MEEQPTCGKGLADTALLPAKLGELASAVGGILEAHIPSLDLTDERSRKERDVYRKLVEDHLRVGLQLEAIGRQMAGLRDLPMGRHEEAAMASPAVRQSFQRFVQVEQELLTMLQRTGAGPAHARRHGSGALAAYTGGRWGIFTVPVVLGGGKSCSPTARRRIRSS